MSDAALAALYLSGAALLFCIDACLLYVMWRAYSLFRDLRAQDRAAFRYSVLRRIEGGS